MHLKGETAVNIEKIKYSIVCLLSFLLIPFCVCANIVWPSLYIAEGMRSWYVILTGFAIEIVFVKCFLKETYWKSIFIAFIMNLVSAVIGVVAIPLSGFIGEILMIPFGTGTFHPTHWLVSYFFAILSNVLVEGMTVKFVFKHNFKKMFWWLCVANAVSVIICILFHGFTMQNITM